MRFLPRFRRSAAPEPKAPARSTPLPITFQQYVDFFKYGGSSYGLTGLQQTMPGQKVEPIEPTFGGFVRQAYKSNGVVFACMLVRMLLFSEARFQFRQLRGGRPGDMFGTAALGPLERPWPGATTGDLLARAIQDADLAGNFFAARRSDRIMRLRPDWVTIVAGSHADADADIADIDAEVIGYLYHPGGRLSGRDPVSLGMDEVAHFAPIPDPDFRFRGMSWLTPIITEIMGDQAAADHKLRFFEHGATMNHAIVFDKDVVRDRETFEAWRDVIEESHAGLENAYKTLYLAAGADVKAIGADMKQLDFKIVQGGGETRVAAASGVPAVIVGLSEGMQAATYSNFTQARRRLSDGTMRPLWRNMAGSLESIIDVPSGSQLWYDTRDIAFLREDEEAAAKILATQASAMRLLVDGGFQADTVIDAVTSGDLSRLVHSGLMSVQLLPEGQPPNGGGNGEASARALLASLIGEEH